MATKTQDAPKNTEKKNGAASETTETKKRGRAPKAHKFFNSKLAENLPRGLKILEGENVIRAVYMKKDKDGKEVKASKDDAGAFEKEPEKRSTFKYIGLDPEVPANEAMIAYQKHFANLDNFNALNFQRDAINSAISGYLDREAKKTKGALALSDTLLAIPEIPGMKEPDRVKIAATKLENLKKQGKKNEDGTVSVSKDALLEAMKAAGFDISVLSK